MKKVMKVVAALLIVCLLIGIPSVNAVYFSDVSTDNLTRENFDAINYVSDNGWIIGTSSTKFSPSNVLTRAMFVTILYRMSGSTEKYSNDFTDVATTDYFYDAVGWAAHYGIVNGMTTTTFVPHNSLTREQMFTILFRYTTQYLGKTCSIAQTIGSLADYSSISPYAHTAFRWVRTYHILQISNTGYAYPQRNVTRADAALFLTRFSREMIGFPEKDRFSFINASRNFTAGRLRMNTRTYTALMSFINSYYGTTSQGIKNKENVQAALNESFSGVCHGMAMCLYLDKIGKIDFNKNFGNVSTMQAVGNPKLEESGTIESAIVFYQVLQSLTGYRKTNFYRDDSNLDTGIEELRSYVNNNGATVIGYGWKEQDPVTGLWSTYGHALIALSVSFSSSTSTYTMKAIDVNVTTENPRTVTITCNGEDMTLSRDGEAGRTLTRISYFTKEQLSYLNYFDLDGAYNDMDYSKSAASTSAYAPETDVFCADENAILTVPYTAFTIENAEGEVLYSDGSTLSGTMDVLDYYCTPNGEEYAAKLTLAVKKSDVFTFTNLSAEPAVFTAISNDYFGSVSGDNLDAVSLDMQGQEIYVNGENMSYSIISRAETDAYDYFYISGENQSSFSICVENGLVSTSGITGMQSIALTRADGTVTQPMLLDFTGENTLDFTETIRGNAFQFIGAGDRTEIICE